jgi:hypothetical protein
MTSRPLTAAVALLAVTAFASQVSGSPRLSIKAAENVTWRFIVIDKSEFSEYPAYYTGAGIEQCKRLTALHVRCPYEVWERGDRNDPEAPPNPKICNRVVDVRLKPGHRPTGTKRSLGCHLEN